MREDGVFRLASMTKALTAVTALSLVDRGVISLDDPVTRYLPEFAPKLGDGSAPPIMIRELLTHISGLSYSFFEPEGGPYHRAGVSDGVDAPGRSWSDNERRLAGVPLVAPPGTRFRYSLSTDVLGEVIAHAAKLPLPALVARAVTAPLGLRDTGFSVSDPARLVTPYANQASGPPIKMTDGIVIPFAGGGVARHRASSTPRRIHRAAPERWAPRATTCDSSKRCAPDTSGSRRRPTPRRCAISSRAPMPASSGPARASAFSPR